MVHDVILQGVQQELTAQRNYQDLVNYHGFTGSYQVVDVDGITDAASRVEVESGGKPLIPSGRRN